ncbi:MAG TPA: response regulator [Terriglobales bacterium]|nr:response regulator [Terriglobales bacterium]
MALVALVVDDSMLIRHTVCRFLQERGFTVESATNPLEALEILAHLRPNLIVTDMQMPKMTGSEFITLLKQNPETQSIPIFVVSGRQSGFDGNENRADYCIYKDIDVESQLGKALDASMRGRAASSAK